MLNNFNFSFPTEIVFGKDSIKQLPTLIKKYSGRKVLFIYGKKSIFENGIYNLIVNQLNKTKIGFIEYGGCDQNPDASYVDKGARMAINNKVDFILAVGGGSAIDTAKAIALLIKNDYRGGIWPYMLSKKEVINDALPIGVILTSVGTGSEGNGSFIISNKETSEKLGRSHLSSRPTFSICDPYYTVSLGKFQTACGCADIVSHLLEQYFCKEEYSFSDHLIIAALKNVIRNSLIVNKNPNNIDSRSNLMLASIFSLSYALSLGKTLDWSAHKIEHAISGIYSVAHAAGMACILPAWMKCASKNKIILNRILKLGKETNLPLKKGSNNKSVDMVINYFKKFFTDMGLPVNLTKLLNREPDINKIAELTVKYGNIGKIYLINKNKCIEIIKMTT